jgi:hypothetical protein
MSQAFNVYLNGKKIDTVFYGNVPVDEEDVRQSLIEDGYDSNIVVRRGTD